MQDPEIVVLPIRRRLIGGCAGTDLRAEYLTHDASEPTKT